MKPEEQISRLKKIQVLQRAFIRDYKLSPPRECLLCECGDVKRCASCGADTGCGRKSHDNFEEHNLVKNVIASENRTRRAIDHVEGNPT